MTHEIADTLFEPYGVMGRTQAIVVCSCGWRSNPGGRDEVASEFTEHVTKGEELRSLFR